MNINLDSLLVGNHQKNAQKRQEEVVVVDSEMETVTESTDDEMKPNAPKKWILVQTKKMQIKL